MLSKTESNAIRQIVSSAREDGQVTDQQYELIEQALDRNTAATMTPADATALFPGLYHAWFQGDIQSDCAVGRRADGSTWCAPVNTCPELFAWHNVIRIEPLKTTLRHV